METGANKYPQLHRRILRGNISFRMLISQQLGRYHLLDRIAFGGMAEIFRAKTFDSRGKEKVVAIKRVLSHLAEDDDFLQMLVDEAKITSMIRHPNIAAIYEFVRVDQEYFIAMEYIDGKDLRSILDRCCAEGIWLSPADCAFIIYKALEGLHHAHETRDGTGNLLSIVHRDVSPSNVIVSYQGEIKLCDFGIAKAKHSRIQTRAGVIKGKVKYMSPEQAMGHPVDRRSDIFSAGSVLYELLTKQCPFQADNEMELIFLVRDAKFLRPSKINPNTPPALEKIVKKAMSRAPSSRFQTAQEFAQTLENFIRTFAPNYTQDHFVRLMNRIFTNEIAQERGLLDEFTLTRADPAALGDNLLGEVLGEGAAYTKFTPNPDSQGLQDVKTRLMPRVPEPETRLPAGVNLHHMKTTIFDPEERVSRVKKRKQRQKPGANYDEEMNRETQHGTHVLKPLPTEPERRDKRFHDMPTKILPQNQPPKKNPK